MARRARELRYLARLNSFESDRTGVLNTARYTTVLGGTIWHANRSVQGIHRSVGDGEKSSGIKSSGDSGRVLLGTNAPLNEAAPECKAE